MKASEKFDETWNIFIVMFMCGVSVIHLGSSIETYVVVQNQL